jgi:hypothetical protein
MTAGSKGARMKRRTSLLLGFVGVLVASPIAAQEISGGGKVGLSVANLSSDVDGVDTDTQSGLAAGGHVTIAINDLLSIQPEVMFVQKGSTFGENGPSISLDYVEFPILAVFTWQTSGNVTPFVYAGPSFGANMSATVEMDGEVEDLDDEVKDSDVSIVFGGGVDISGFIVDARYEAGVSTIAEAGDDTKTSAFLILAGFCFGN